MMARPVVTAKLGAATIGAAAATILAAILNGFGLDVTTPVEGAIATICAFLFGLWIRDTPESFSAQETPPRAVPPPLEPPAG